MLFGDTAELESRLQQIEDFFHAARAFDEDDFARARGESIAGILEGRLRDALLESGVESHQLADGKELRWLLKEPLTSLQTAYADALLTLLMLRNAKAWTDRVRQELRTNLLTIHAMESDLELSKSRRGGRPKGSIGSSQTIIRALLKLHPDAKRSKQLWPLLKRMQGVTEQPDGAVAFPDGKTLTFSSFPALLSAARRKI